MNALHLDLSCPQCAGPTDYVNGSSNGLLALAVVRCEFCKREYEITARIKPLPVANLSTGRRKVAA